MKEMAETVTLPTPGATRTSVVAALVAGACGLAFALSPLTMVAVATMIALCWRTAATLDAGDRASFWWIVASAIALRLGVVVALFAAAPMTGHNVLTLAPDAEYGIERTMILRNLWA